MNNDRVLKDKFCHYIWVQYIKCILRNACLKTRIFTADVWLINYFATQLFCYFWKPIYSQKLNVKSWNFFHKKVWKAFLDSDFQFLSAFYIQFLRIYWLKNIRYSWMAKSLMSHAFAVKIRVFKHASHKIHLTYWTQIFWHNLSFKALSLFTADDLIAQ